MIKVLINQTSLSSQKLGGRIINIVYMWKRNFPTTVFGTNEFEGRREGRRINEQEISNFSCLTSWKREKLRAIN